MIFLKTGLKIKYNNKWRYKYEKSIIDSPRKNN